MIARRNKGAKAIILALLLLVAMTPLAAAAQFFYTGQISGDCVNANINVTARVYNQGSINDPGNLVDTASALTAADGTYGFISNNLVQLTTYDINVSASNTGCSPSAYKTSATTDTTDSDIQPPAFVTTNLALSATFAGTVPSNNSYAQNETQFNWTSDYVGVSNYTLLISTSPTFASLERTITGITDKGYELTGAEELPDEVYYWKVLAYDASGTNIDNTSRMTFEVAMGAAIITSASPTNGTWVGTTTRAVTLQTQLEATCRYSTSSGTAYAAMTAFSSTGTTNHTTTLTLSSEGANAFYIKCNTSAGVVNAVDQQYVLNRDTTPPSPAAASVSIDGGSALSTDTTLDFTWAGFSDSGSGIASYYYSFSDNGGTVIGTNDASSPGQLAGASQGAVIVYVWAVDNLGNIGAAASDSIVVDSQPPVFSSWSTTPANLNKYWTGDFDVSVTIYEVAGISGLPSFRYRIGSDAWSSWSNLTYDSAVGYYRNYIFTIPEAASPNTWFLRAGENLTYQVLATDLYDRSNNVTNYELIVEEAMAPVLSPIANQEVDQDDLLVINLTAYDQDMDTLTYTCNFSATITKTNNTFAVARWTPDNDDVGTYSASCRVTDGIFTDTETFTMTVNNINDAPVLGTIGALYAQEYVFFNYTLNASDVDGDDISYSSNATIFSINRLTGKIAFTPFQSQRGTYSINYTITDGNGGYDYEVATFTVGYCGDGTCRSAYEDCTTCEVDCGVCGLESSKAIIMEPRNCLDDDITVQAVSLVPRATCEEEGAIVDDMEVCGGEDGATLQLYILDSDGSWDERTRLVADDDGYATFTVDEAGDYKIAYSSDTDIYELFEVKACAADEESGGSSGSVTPSKDPDEPVSPPIIEEPTAVDDLQSRWTFFSIFLYFFVLPLLFIALVITSLGYVYRLEKQKQHKNSFVKMMDQWHKEYHDYKRKTLAWMRKTSPFREALVYLSRARAEMMKAWRFARGLATEYWSALIVALGLRRKVKLEYFAVDAPGKTMHLVLISILKNLFPKRSVSDLLGLTYEYSVQNLMDIAAMLMSFGVRVTYFDSQPANVTYLNSMLAKGLEFKNRIPTRVEVESSLEAGRPVLAVVNELGERNTIIQSVVIVYAFDKHHFYYHDYLHGRQGLRATKDQFMHAWKAAGYKGVFMRMK